MAKRSLSVHQRNMLSAQRREILAKKKKGELTESQQERLRHIEEQLNIQQKNVRQKIRSITSKNPAPVETNNVSDQQRMDRAVSIGMQQGLIREEIFPSDTPTTKNGYILSSAHYSNDEYYLEKTRSSQIQLFQFMHLANTEGVRGPLYCEGRMQGMRYASFPSRTPQITIHGDDYDIHNPEAQKFLFEHPTALKEMMDMQLHAAEKQKTTAPIFYQYTNYANIQGAHTSRVEEKMSDMIAGAQWSKEFSKHFAFFTKIIGSGTVDITFETGWDKSEKPMLKLANRWIYTNEIIPLIEYYLAYADKLAEFDEMREEDMATFMLQTDENQTPLCFCGIGHTLELAKRMTDQMNVHILTPTDSVYLDNQRRILPINHPDAGLLNIDVYQKVLQVAKSVEDRS